MVALTERTDLTRARLPATCKKIYVFFLKHEGKIGNARSICGRFRIPGYGEKVVCLPAAPRACSISTADSTDTSGPPKPGGTGRPLSHRENPGRRGGRKDHDGGDLPGQIARPIRRGGVSPSRKRPGRTRRNRLPGGSHCVGARTVSSLCSHSWLFVHPAPTRSASVVGEALPPLQGILAFPHSGGSRLVRFLHC